MFKKTTIAIFAIFIMLVSTMASAVKINQAGSAGNVLIFPYYNVNNQFTTSFNLTNTADDYKAVKIRFRESENSNDVLDFNLYLSPHDIFTMWLVRGSDGGVKLQTTDRSCTHPTIPKGGVLFRHQAYDSTDTDDVREGYLEVIEMGILDKTAEIENAFGEDQLIASQGVLHDADGIPFDCSVIEQAWQQGVFTQGGAASNIKPIDIVNPKSPGYTAQNVPSMPGWYGQSRPLGVLPPTGGLVGSEILIDVATITGFVAEPISVQNYSTRAQHYLSSDENFYLLPSLASGSSLVAERFEGDVTYGPVVRDWGMDDIEVAPRVSVPSGINPLPLADVMAVTSVGNQYFLGPNTYTDWVISSPLRKHAIYNDYQYTSAPAVALATLPEGAIPVGLKDSEASDATKLATANENGYWAFLDQSDISGSFVFYDREEQTKASEPGDFSPPIQTPDSRVPIEREVNIFTFLPETRTTSENESVLGSANSRQVSMPFIDGWGRLTFAGYDLNATRYLEWQTAAPGVSAPGAPLSGFMAARGAVGSSHVGETFLHVYTK